MMLHIKYQGSRPCGFLTPSVARYENRFLCATGTSTACGKHIIVYMRVVSTIIVKGQNSLILICSRMKELTFSRFIP